MFATAIQDVTFFLGYRDGVQDGVKDWPIQVHEKVGGMGGVESLWEEPEQTALRNSGHYGNTTRYEETRVENLRLEMLFEFLASAKLVTRTPQPWAMSVQASLSWITQIRPPT